MNWLKKLLNKVAGSETETNQEKEFERKVKANDWINPVMDINESEVIADDQMAQEEMEKVRGVEQGNVMPEEAVEEMVEDLEKIDRSIWNTLGIRSRTDMEDKGLVDKYEAMVRETLDELQIGAYDLSEDVLLGLERDNFHSIYRVVDEYRKTASKNSKIKKKSAFEWGDTPEDTIDKDYELRIKALSDYNLAEMLHEYDQQEKGLATTVQVEAKDKMKKYVENNRTEAENKLTKLIGDHSRLDIKKAFEKFKDDEEYKQTKEEALYKPEGPSGKQNWEKSEDFKAPSDKEKLEQMEGTGTEEEKGQVGKDASQKKKAAIEKRTKEVTRLEKRLPDGSLLIHEKITEERDVEDPSKIESKEASQKKADSELCERCGKNIEQDECTCYKEKESELTHSDTCERCRQLYPGVCDTCKKNKELGTYRKDAFLKKKALGYDQEVNIDPKMLDSLVDAIGKIDPDDTYAVIERINPPTLMIETHESEKVDALITQYEAKYPRSMSRRRSSEIKSKVTKKAAFKKIAEVESPWYVFENEQGEKVIAKRTQPSTTKESKEDEEQINSKTDLK